MVRSISINIPQRKLVSIEQTIIQAHVFASAIAGHQEGRSLLWALLSMGAVSIGRDAMKFLQDARSKRGWVCLKWLLRYSAALVVVAVIAVGVVSLVLNNAEIARSCRGCTDIDCVQIRDWWSCSSLTTLKPQASCLFDQNSNATTTITCPSVGL